MGRTLTYSSGNTSYTYELRPRINQIYITVEGAAGGDGGDAGIDDGGIGGSGGLIDAQKDVSGLSDGSVFDIAIGDGGGNGQTADTSVGGSAGAGGSGGASPANNGGDGGDGQANMSDDDYGAGGGGGGGETRLVSPNGDVAYAGAGGGGGGANDDASGGGGGGGGAPGGSGAVSSDAQSEDGYDAQGTGLGGDGGSQTSDRGDPGGDGGATAEGIWTINSTTTGGSTQIGSGYVEIQEGGPASGSVSVDSYTQNSITLLLSSSTDANGYYIYKSTTEGFSPTTSNRIADISRSGSSQTYQDTGLVQGTEYHYVVEAYNSEGVTGEGVSQITVFPNPDQFSIDNFTDTTTESTWNLQTTEEDGVKVFRSISGDAYQEVADLPPGTESYTDTGLLNGRDYSYYASAYTQDTSSDSNTDSIQTVLNNPTNLQPFSENKNEIGADWESDLNNGNFYIEYERLSDNTIVSTDSPSYTTYTSLISNVDDGVAYEIRIRSETQDTTGDFVSEQYRVYIPRPWIASHYFTNDGTAVIEWEKKDSYNGGVFQLYRSDTPDGNMELIDENPDAATGKFVDANINTEEEYYYTVRRYIE